MKKTLSLLFTFFLFLCRAADPVSATLLSSGKTYPGFGIENSLDGDPGNNYTAFQENAEQTFTLALSTPVRELGGFLEFESEENYASDWQIYVLDQAGKAIPAFTKKGAKGKRQFFEFHARETFTRIKFVFTKFHGQKRLLLRQVAIPRQPLQMDCSRCEFRPFAASLADSINRVSIAEVDSRRLLFANYQNLLLFDRATGKHEVLTPDFSLLVRNDKQQNPVYVPTGVAIDCDGEVYLANYRGNNILRGKIQGGKIVFSRQYSSRQSRGPENVSVDKKRDILVSANYDGGTVTAFQISTGKQLWSTPVGQAHGVVIDQDFVYASSLLTRDIQKLDVKTGKVIFRRGEIGWVPAANQYLWPTSVQVLDRDHLVVADAQSGFISKVRKADLKVVGYFGGNGPGFNQFNYPYVAVVLGDGLYVSSARRAGLLRLKLNPLRAETLWYHPKFCSRMEYTSSPLGRNWNGYRDMDAGHKIWFYGHTFGMGFGKIYVCRTNQEFMITDAGSLYNPPNYLYFMQGKQLSGNGSVFLASSAPILYGIFEPDPELPALLLSLSVGLDTWLTDDGNLLYAGQHFPLTDIVKKMQERVDILQKKMRTQGRLTLEDLIQHAFITTSSYGGLVRLPLARTLDCSFVSLEGRKFLWRYNHDSKDLAAIRKAAAEYYRQVHGIPYLRLDEYLLVGMLSGVSPRTLSMKDTVFSKVNPQQKLLALSALITSDLNDYTAANTISDSKFYFSPPFSEAKLNRLELIWYSPQESGEELRISGITPDGKRTVLFNEKIEKSILSEYTVSTVKLNAKQAYPKYLFEVLKGGKQNRLLLRAFTPEWEEKITDPLLRFAREVSLKKTYGTGVLSLPSDRILEQAKTWHCGGYALWFARHFPLKYKQIKIIDLQAMTNAVHTVVEVTLADGTTKVADPTHGIVYDSDIRSMLNGAFDFETGTHFSRAVSPVFDLQYGPQFFYQAKIKRIYSESEWKGTLTLSKNTVIRKKIFNGAEFNVIELQLDFSRMPGVPGRIQAFSTDSQYKRKYETLVDISGNTQSSLRIPVNKRAAHINFTFTDFVLPEVESTNTSMEPLITVKLDEAELKKFKQYQNLHKKIIMQANDPENPLAIRFPITEFYYVKAEEILRKHNLQNGSDFAKILAFMEEITFMNVGYPQGRTPFEWTNERIGDCGTFSYILLALAKTQNLKGQVMNMWNYPKGSGHVVTEIYCQGEPYVFDPTYGLYFKNEKTGKVMSFEELRNPANKAVPVYINKQRYAKSGEQSGWGTQRVYLHGNPIGPIGPDKPMIFPLFLKAGDVANMPSLSAFQGAEYLGAGITNNNHHWTFSGLTPGKNYRFVLTPGGIGGHASGKNFTFTYRLFKPDAAEPESVRTITLDHDKLSPVEIDFAATAPVMALDLLHPYNNDRRFCYLSVRKYELKERE